jgi:hypothetical protein
MSYDFRLDILCPHKVILEELVLTNFQELRTISKLASSIVEVWVDSNLIPNDGLYSKATTAAKNTGVLQIVRDLNDTIEVSVDDGSMQTYIIKSGLVTLYQIMSDLKKKMSGVDLTIQNNILRFSTQSRNKNSKLVWGSGSAHLTLGLPNNRVYVSNEIVPSWNIVNDPISIESRMVYFNKPLKCSDSIIELTYYTSSDYCRRCNGLRIENDFIYNDLGEKVLVKEENLLLQELDKAIITIKNSNPFHLWIGTRIASLSGSKYLNVIKSEILSEITDTLSNLKDIKIQQAQIQEVTPGEFPDVLQISKMNQLESDMTILEITIDVISRRGKQVSLNRYLKLSIDGSTQGYLRRG